MHKKTIAEEFSKNGIDNNKIKLFADISKSLLGGASVTVEEVREKKVYLANIIGKSSGFKIKNEVVTDYIVNNLLYDFLFDKSYNKLVSTLLGLQGADEGFISKEVSMRWFSNIKDINKVSLLLTNNGYENYSIALDLWRLEWLLSTEQNKEAKELAIDIEKRHPELLLVNNKNMSLEEFEKNTLLQIFSHQKNKVNPIYSEQ